MREDPGVGRSGWLAVVPIKPLPAAKSRLRGAVAGVPHERLVLAMAKDTVAATLACGRVDRVVVVTDDPLAGAALAASGAAWVRDLPRAGLNAAFAHSGLRLLRLGQRVRLERNESGELVRLTLPTLP